VAAEIDPLAMIPSKSKYSMDRVDPADLAELRGAFGDGIEDHGVDWSAWLTKS